MRIFPDKKSGPIDRYVKSTENRVIGDGIKNNKIVGRNNTGYFCKKKYVKDFFFFKRKRISKISHRFIETPC